MDLGLWFRCDLSSTVTFFGFGAPQTVLRVPSICLDLAGFGRAGQPTLMSFYTPFLILPFVFFRLLRFLSLPKLGHAPSQTVPFSGPPLSPPSLCSPIESASLDLFEVPFDPPSDPSAPPDPSKYSFLFLRPFLLTKFRTL